MILLLFLIWLVLSGDLSAAGLMVGLLLSGVLGYFSHRILKLPLFVAREVCTKLSKIMGYIGYLLIQVVYSNIQIAKEILSPSQRHRGTLIWVESELQHKAHQVLLANSITLTPGTVTVSLKNGRLCVYSFHETNAKEWKNNGFLIRLKKWEEAK